MKRFRVMSGQLVLQKEPTELDRFVLTAVDIISKYTDYVLVSGYVAIFFGRARMSEDVDLFVKKVPFESFRKMYEEFRKNCFEWTIDDPKQLYDDYLTRGLPVAVWQQHIPLLRIDMKLPKEKSQHGLFSDKLHVNYNSHILWMASIESTIAYKETIANSEKDLLDAQHLRSIFDGLDEGKIDKYKKWFLNEFHHAR